MRSRPENFGVLLSFSFPFPLFLSSKRLLKAYYKRRTEERTMGFKLLLSTALPIVGLLLLTTPAHAQCENPSVRREWRQFSTDEKAEWISAVKVSPLLLNYRVVIFYFGV